MRALFFAGRSREELRSFPATARETTGRQLLLVQRGLEPKDWKPMKTIGPGVAEIRIHDQTGAYRVIYLAKFKDAVHVLHCFEKKSQKTARSDLELAANRYRELLRARVQD